MVSWDGVRERLAELAAADPGFERFGANRHEYRLGPPLPRAELAEFEARHGVTLPEDYRDFLLTVGGHGAGPYYGLYSLGAPECPDEDEWRAGFLSTPFPHTSGWNRAEHHPVDNEIPDDRYFDQRWITGSLNVAHFGCGAYFRLVVAGPERGRVWFDDRASDGGISPSDLHFREWYLEWLNQP
ncbi:SMI1/KNR4 family protein [Amycolatopsis sp. OK19-0408]|uniref:SMI1/KNR4 family protein n=1 Tax=Amycolatopsis iheyensis TaxID=2945988 RepID=A0A9X2SQI7_9PSEU|nr:SMI1/KNR4 family protein [Amycolatopsis iheyensis]MCR6489728.1 SMI1/KNR4 family protein [Amycolatopsis iheyensis]